MLTITRMRLALSLEGRRGHSTMICFRDSMASGSGLGLERQATGDSVTSEKFLR